MGIRVMVVRGSDSPEGLGARKMQGLAGRIGRPHQAAGPAIGAAYNRPQAATRRAWTQPTPSSPRPNQLEAVWYLRCGNWNGNHSPPHTARPPAAVPSVTAIWRSSAAAGSAARWRARPRPRESRYGSPAARTLQR